MLKYLKSRKKNFPVEFLRGGYHLVFWVLYTILTVNYFRGWGPFEKVLLYTAGYMFILMFISYINYFYLFPHYFLGRRYKQYVFSLGLVLVIALPLKVKYDLLCLAKEPTWAYSFGHYFTTFFTFMCFILGSYWWRLTVAWFDKAGEVVADEKATPISLANGLEIDQDNTQSRTSLPSESNINNYLFVKSDSKMQKIWYNDIYYIEGLKEYVSIYTASERVISLLSLKSLEKVLPPSQFIRVHKSYIVALDKIEAVSGNKIEMYNKVIPIGKTYKAATGESLNTVKKQKH